MSCCEFVTGKHCRKRKRESLTEILLPTLYVRNETRGGTGEYKVGDTVGVFLRAHRPNYNNVSFLNVEVRVIPLDPPNGISFLIYRVPELTWSDELLMKLTDWTIPQEFARFRSIRMIATYTAVLREEEQRIDKISMETLVITN